MNNTQLLNQIGGPTEAEVLEARIPPPAILPTQDTVFATDASYRVKWSEHGIPQTILPHMPQEYVYH
jgi:hypothetical protein